MSLKKDILWRVGLVYAMFFILGITILGRILYLQVVEGEKWSSKEQTLTSKDFEFFKSECKKWLKVLGLQSWEVKFSFKKIADYAECFFHYRGRIAIITLTTDLGR